MAESGFNNKETLEQQPPIGFAPPPPNQYGNNPYPSLNTFNITDQPPSYAQNQPYPPAGAPGVTVITQQPIVTSVSVGSKPARITCPHCLADVTTKVTYDTGILTHIIAASLCVICLCTIVCPCCWIPYVTDCSKDATHECPNCNKYIGTYKTFK